ncbi:MAG: hypothetical protein ABI045_03980 [Flavobacteriales bacterium]
MNLYVATLIPDRRTASSLLPIAMKIPPKIYKYRRLSELMT